MGRTVLAQLMMPAYEKNRDVVVFFCFFIIVGTSLSSARWRPRLQIIGYRKRELCRREPKDKSPNWAIFGVETASCLRETHQEGQGAATHLS